MPPGGLAHLSPYHGGNLMHLCFSPSNQTWFLLMERSATRCSLSLFDRKSSHRSYVEGLVWFFKFLLPCASGLHFRTPLPWNRLSCWQHLTRLKGRNVALILRGNNVCIIDFLSLRPVTKSSNNQWISATAGTDKSTDTLLSLRHVSYVFTKQLIHWLCPFW